MTSDLLMKALHSYPDGSRSRQQCSTALASLAKHLNIDLPDDWRAEAAGYGLHRARFRQLPSDSLILESLLRIPNPRWRLAYGLMATYGLRNHEVFFCDLSALGSGGDRVIRVLPTTKTGEHQVWPFHPEWVERFDLTRLGNASDALPSISTDLRRTTLQQVGRRVSEQFRRYELPLTPYDLRHAWAVRTIHIGLPDTVSAPGCTPWQSTTHLSAYHRHHWDHPSDRLVFRAYEMWTTNGNGFALIERICRRIQKAYNWDVQQTQAEFTYGSRRGFGCHPVTASDPLDAHP